ncbi:CinA family protein [Parafrigoribacterium mesophilum]|uniref:CinA family protein n=1 Tax=Parafrigoribacterium mesophilum TaxID=433646 RepID=UPI0031FCFCC8
MSNQLSAQVIAALTARGETIGVAESLTGGALAAELIATPGASVVVNGGIVAYRTALKHALLGVDAALLAEHGAVHPQVAAQMAVGVRDALAVDGVPASIGLSTTGVAGPDPQDGHPVGTVYLGLAHGDKARTRALALSGTRNEIRRAVVDAALRWLVEELGIPAG